jgi:CheY-like chemotaxis protein
MEPAAQRSLRADPQTVASWLDRLDRRIAPPTRLNLRRSERFAYRPPELMLELPQEEGGSTCHAVACRNISREGLGLLAGQLIYPQSACRITLVSPYGRRQTVAGRVARCRYLVGSGSLYEVGIDFDRPIDVAVLAPQARLVRVLLVDAAATTHQLVSSFLHSLRARLTCAVTADEAASAMAGEDFDLVLIDLESESFDAFGLVRQFRGAGYVGPVIGMTVQPGTDLHARCESAGCTGYISKPITRDDVHSLVGSLTHPPLVSPLAQDQALAPLIDGFVAGLRERVAAMSLAGQADDLDTLERIVRDLRAEAGSYGFIPITEEAAYVQALIAASQPREKILRAVRRLMHLCLKARPATCPPESLPGPPEPAAIGPARPDPGRKPASSLRNRRR